MTKLSQFRMRAPALGVAITIGVGFPWSATAADSPQAGPLSALRHDQIPAYELRIAGAVDPAAASPSLVAILGDSRLKLMEYVGRMVYTADGRSIIAAANHEIAFWNPRTGEQERVLRGRAGRVAALAMSLDGRTLVSGSYDHLVKVWDVAGGTERRTLKGHENFVTAVAISSDGNLVASADGQIRLWELAGAPERIHMRQIGEPGRFVTALALSPEGRTLVSGAGDGKIHVWDVTTGREVKTLSASTRPEQWIALAFSPDGSVLAATGEVQGVFLWDTRTWLIRHEVTQQGGLGAQALAFTHDGRRLAVSMDFAARVLDVATGKEVRRFPKQSVGMNAVAVSPDGGTVATSGLTIKLWDMATGQEKTPGMAGHGGSLESVAFSPDGTTLATASWDQTVKLWDIATRRERKTLTGHTSMVMSVGFSPDGKLLASISRARELMLWDLASGKNLRTWEAASNPGQRVCFSPDGRWVAAETRERVQGRHIGIWETASGKQVAKVVSGDSTYMFTPDGTKLVLVGESPLRNRLVVWDIEHATAERMTEGELLPSGLSTAALSRDGRIIALAGWEHDRNDEGKACIVLWDLPAERPIYGLDQWADHLAFSPDDRTLIGVGRDGKAQVWDPRNGTLRETIQVCEAGEFAIRDLAVAPDSRHFATAMGNGTARIFRLMPPPERVEPRDPLPLVAARPDPPIDLWKQLIGNPAPEFRDIQAWAGGPPVRLADLRGKFVLLHFWNTTSALQMVKFIELHEKFAERGLVIIAVQPDWGIIGAKDWQARALRQQEWGDRALPFRIALDGERKTPIEESDAMAPGATFAAFRVQSGQRGMALQPVNLLIGRDGRVRMGVDSPRLLEKELEAEMGVKAKVPVLRE